MSGSLRRAFMSVITFSTAVLLNVRHAGYTGPNERQRSEALDAYNNRKQTHRDWDACTAAQAGHSTGFLALSIHALNDAYIHRTNEAHLRVPRIIGTLRQHAPAERNGGEHSRERQFHLYLQFVYAVVEWWWVKHRRGADVGCCFCFICWPLARGAHGEPQRNGGSVLTRTRSMSYKGTPDRRREIRRLIFHQPIREGRIRRAGVVDKMDNGR
jgi:hypothetical protein